MSGQALSRKFLASISEKSHIFALFEHLPGVFFLVKDAQGRFMGGNRALRERLGAPDPDDFLGKTDADFVPDHLVRAFQDDDALVLRTGRPIVNRLESWLDEQRQLQWFLTSKLPVFGRNGRPTGVMAVIRRQEGGRSSPITGVAAAAVAHVRAHLREPLSTRAIAKAVGVSERNLHRKLVGALGFTPHELVLRERTEAAARRLADSADPIADIAAEQGFCDQSAFTKHFRLRTGLTPRRFRIRHQGG